MQPRAMGFSVRCFKDVPDAPTYDQYGYLADGLILHLDGINNTGTGHSSALTVWKDLTTNEYDTQLFDATIGEHSIIFDGIHSYGIIDTGLNIPSPSTIEIVLKTPRRNSIYFQDKTNTHSLGYWGTVSGFPTTKSTQPTFPVEANSPLDNGEIFTLTRNYTSDTNVELKLNTVAMTQSGADNNWIGQSAGTNYLGRRGAGSNPTYPFSGEIYAVRIYDHILTDAEIASNYAVDQVRFVDSTPPVPPLTGFTISYTPPQASGTTVGPVTANISFDTGGIIIDNNSGFTDRAFTINGSYTFRFHNAEGQTGEATAVVDWIVAIPPSSNYEGTGSIQTWTAPMDGDYIIEARGARGGNGATGYAAGSLMAGGI
jgi:hypothetical protein